MPGSYREYNVEYYSRNSYQEQVKDGMFEFNVSPCNDDTQILIEDKVSQNLGDSAFRQTNLFGFATYRIRASAKFNEFIFQYKARIQKAKVQIPGIPALDLNKELEEILSNQFYIQYHLFLGFSPFTSLRKEQLPEVPVYEKNCSVLDFLTRLNKHVHDSMTYEKDITSVTTLACDALKLGKGVCQDFAHVFIAMARHNGLPARYVSGYLYPGMAHKSSSYMHAWVEAYIPGLGWTGFDPTNNLLADEHYIKVSHGADYGDCSPIKGVIRTNGEHKMISEVKVTDL